MGNRPTRPDYQAVGGRDVEEEKLTEGEKEAALADFEVESKWNQLLREADHARLGFRIEDYRNRVRQKSAAMMATPAEAAISRSVYKTGVTDSDRNQLQNMMQSAPCSLSLSA
jgi:hypothetical protein